jgi:hypothetical protein
LAMCGAFHTWRRRMVVVGVALNSVLRKNVSCLKSLFDLFSNGAEMSSLLGIKKFCLSSLL